MSEDIRQEMIDLGYEEDLDCLDRSEKIPYFEIDKLVITECGVLQSIKDINPVGDLTVLEIMNFVHADWLDLLRLPNPQLGIIRFMNEHFQEPTKMIPDLPLEIMLGIGNLQVEHYPIFDEEHEFKYLIKPYQINNLIDFMKAFLMETDLK